MHLWAYAPDLCRRFAAVADAARAARSDCGVDRRWRGAVIAWFALVAVANVYMSVFARLRVDIKAERLEIEGKEQQMKTR